jgi:hypothetical protein
MSECLNAEMRDLLPDLAAERLVGAERARVASHVASCGACQAEIELLTAARRVMSHGVPAVDVARIVAALPKPPGAADAKPALVASSPAAREAPQAGRGDRQDHGVGLSGRGVRFSAPRWTTWRIAAVATIAVGGLTVAVLQHLGSAPMVPPAPVIARTPAVGPQAQPAGPERTPPHTRTPTLARPNVSPPERPTDSGTGIEGGPGFAVAGDISELSDGDVESLVQDMNGLDDQPSADLDAAVPAMPAETAP